MNFEHDTIKATENIKKHGISFEEAKTVWSDPNSIEFYDEENSNDSEDRYIRVGHSQKSRVLLVVYCERDEGNTVRIISARKATPSEREVYEE